MLNKINCRIKQKLIKFVPNENYMHRAFSFGVDMALYTIISTVGLLFLSIIMYSLVPGMIIIATFYLNQTIGGGYHATTHVRCFLSMAFFLTLGIIFSKLVVSSIVSYSLGALSGIILFVCPVVLHPNRAFLKCRLSYFVKRSRCVTISEVLLLFFLSIIEFRYLNAYIIALALSAVSRTAAKYCKHSNVCCKKDKKE